MPNKKNVGHTGLEAALKSDLKSGDTEHLRSDLLGQHPADIAEALERVNSKQRRNAFELLDVHQKAEVLNELSERIARQLLEKYSAPAIAELLDLLPMDEAARLLSTFRRRRASILGAMNTQHSRDVRELLRYPPHSAGRLMTEKFARVTPEMTAEESLALLRRSSADIETLTNLYVIDEAGRLLGVVALREVVVASPRRRIRELMTTDLVTVSPETDREEVARLISKYDFLAMPVISPEGKVLGIITADDVIDVLVAEGGEDILKFGGLQGAAAAEESYFEIPLNIAVRRRVGWLLLLFIGGTLTGNVLRYFEHELSSAVALAFFIPLLIGTGGNTGAQTVSTLIRALAIGEITTRDAWRVVRRELVSGLILGIVLGLVAYVRAIIWNPVPALALAVALTVMAICTWANTIASLIPLAAYRFKIDPAAVSAPMITTVVDATGLAIYLLIAKATLGL